MTRLTIKQWGAVVATAVAVGASGVSANMIWDSDKNGASNATLWDSYAYYYLEGKYNTIDNTEGLDSQKWPNHHLPCFATKTCRTENKGLEEILSAKPAPDADGEWPYAYQAESERAFYMSFKGLGPVCCKYSINPEAGMGLLLSAKAGGDNPQGIGTGFEKVTEIKWKMKLSEDIKQIRFKIETIKTSKKGLGEENAYGKVFSNKTPDKWADYSVKISGTGCADGTKYNDKTGVFPTDCKVGDLTLADYFGFGYKYDGKEALKIAWQIATGGMMDENSALTKGEVWIDKIEIVGYDHKPADVCESCVGAPTVAAPSGAWKLSDLEAPDLAQNLIGQYWYYYNDVEIGGTSDAQDGIQEDEYSPTGYSLKIEGNKKGYNSTNGAWIKYLLGDGVEKDGNTVDAFVGLGTEVFHCPGDPEAAKVLYNAGSDASAGVYFLYQTSFAADKGYLAFEAHDDYAYKNPDGGEVYGVRLLGTGGAWKSATIKFSDMKLPSWAPKNRTGALEPFDKTKIAKFQFKVSGVSSGDFAVDNVYVKGTESPKGRCKSDGPVGIKYNGKKPVAAAGIRATYSRGVIGVNWNAAASVANGKVALVNTKGRVVASAPISAVGNKVTAKLGTGTIPTGMYFVRVTARDVNGKNIVQQTPVSIVK
jgi:hypothetical protein